MKSNELQQRLPGAVIFFFTFALSLTTLTAQTVYHVNGHTGKDTNDGLKWSTAFENLQTAIDSAKVGDEIRIAAGVYHPTEKIADQYGGGREHHATPTNDRHRSFLIEKDLKIYGGYPANANDATGAGSRNWKEHRTVLSGDFANNDGDNFTNREDNAYHVIVLFGATADMVLDGLYITGGYADDDYTVYTDMPESAESRSVYYVTNDGGGLYVYSPMGDASPTLSDVTFYANYADDAGGAMFNCAWIGDASPTITHTWFTGNKAATRHGGALSIDGITVGAELSNVNVVGNTSYLSGGGMYFVSTETCAPRIVNTVVSGNFARHGNGGGICISTNYGDAVPYIINSAICGNRMESFSNKDGGGMTIYPEGISKAHIYNTVIAGNKGIRYDNYYAAGERGTENVVAGSFIEGLDPAGDGNLPGTTEPLFLDPADAALAPTTAGDYQLTLASPLINKGINAHITLTTDLLGHARIYGGMVDIGAYEAQGTPPVDNEVVRSGNTIRSDGRSLYIQIDQPAALHVYAVDGKLVKHTPRLEKGAYTYPLPKGLYLATLSDGTTEKVVIR